ncbi:MAG: transposase [Candidatus Paceibacterota bacterium]
MSDFAARFTDLILADEYNILAVKELDELWNKMKESRCVELLAFALMGNHFHIAVHALKDSGIATYLQRVQNAYTKYFNIKHDRTGHLFQGPYKVVHQPDDERLMMLTAYIHHNPNEVLDSRAEVEAFKWSSYQDYHNNNRWGELLKPEIVLEQFSNPAEYLEFVNDGNVKSTPSVDK